MEINAVSYDALENDSEEDYFAFIHWLEDETAERLKAARGNAGAIKQTPACPRPFTFGVDNIRASDSESK